MRVPDRPWAESSADTSEISARLADRLVRLPAGHPSADIAADPDQDHQNPDGPGADDVAPEDEPGSAGPGEGGGEARAAGFRPGGRSEPASWDAPGGQDRSPYRPWFSADGAGDPWFAEPAEWTSP